jgi:type I restriction enzyme, S subunit
MKFILPELPSGWSPTRLDHVATVNARIGWKALTASEYVPEGYAFLATPNIKSNEIDFEKVNYIDEFRFEESPELKLQRGDVLLVKDGNTLGITNVVSELPRAATVNGSIAVLRTEILDPRFLRYTLASDLVQGMILAVKAGMGVPHLFQADIKKFPLPRPPRLTQRAIADYLDNETTRIDALVAAKRRMVELLEERDRIAFERVVKRHGFVFPPELDPDWHNSVVPTEWKVMRLSQVLEELTNGYVGPTRDILLGSGVPYVQSLHIKNGRIDFSRRHFFVAQLWHDERPRIHLREGDVLIVQTGDIGQVAVVPKGFGEASCHALQIARVKRKIMTGPYLSSYLRSSFGYHSLLSRATGALHPHLEGGIKDIPVVVPPLGAQHAVVEEVDRANEENSKLRSIINVQISLLQERRQALITAAVTGQLDISEAA